VGGNLGGDTAWDGVAAGKMDKARRVGVWKRRRGNQEGDESGRGEASGNSGWRK
jgi:hypothetical protein